MKFGNMRFLAKANIRRNTKSNLICVLMVVLVISLTLISSFAIALTSAVNVYKEDFRARALEMDPLNKPLTKDVIKQIEKVDHVESVNILKGMRDQYFDILNISDENGTYKELQDQIDKRDCYFQAWSLIGDEKKSVIVGKTLDESPVFSCIVPSLFYPFEYEDTDEDLDYIDGEILLGKTITIKADEYFADLYNYEVNAPDYEMFGSNEWVHLPALEYKLKIVGVYYAAPTGNSFYDSIFVSEETGEKIEEMALKASDIDMNSKTDPVALWWNTPSLRTHYVVVDDYDNISKVVEKIWDMGIDIANDSEIGIKEGVMATSSILSIGALVLIGATGLLCIINLIQSSTNSIVSRKGEIGLMKAIGYKNRQIFGSLYYEQLIMTFKGFIIGGGISAIFIAISNYKFNHSTYVNRLYVVSWTDYLIFLGISLCISLIVPLICQLITLHKLTSIQPREAMNSK